MGATRTTRTGAEQHDDAGYFHQHYRPNSKLLDYNRPPRLHVLTYKLLTAVRLRTGCQPQTAVVAAAAAAKGNAASMGQRMARHQMQRGVQLYHDRRHEAAVQRWRSALQRLTNPEDRFITFGYLAQAFHDAGDHDGALHYALLQMELAEQRQDSYMKAEAFLNLAKAHERQADYAKAIGYARAALQHPSLDARTPGYAQLVIAQAQMGLSQWQASLEAFEKSMQVANETRDRLLELQICVSIGAFFTLLMDLSKALIFLRNALSILQTVTVDDVHAKYRCQVLYHLAVVLRKRGCLVEARDAAEESCELAAELGNRVLAARCSVALADIYSLLGESEAQETLTAWWARYEDAFRVMREMGDRLGELLVLSAMARAAAARRSHYSGHCECQAIQLNKKCVEAARQLGARHVLLKAHRRLAELYAQLEDDESEETARHAASNLTRQMELFCNFCGQRFGERDESLQALRCSHIFHEKCLHTYLAERADQQCPKCACRAVVMDNISVRGADTASVASSSTIVAAVPLPLSLSSSQAAVHTSANDPGALFPVAMPPPYAPIPRARSPRKLTEKSSLPPKPPPLLSNYEALADAAAASTSAAATAVAPLDRSARHRADCTRHHRGGGQHAHSPILSVPNLDGTPGVAVAAAPPSGSSSLDDTTLTRTHRSRDREADDEEDDGDDNDGDDDGKQLRNSTVGTRKTPLVKQQAVVVVAQKTKKKPTTSLTPTASVSSSSTVTTQSTSAAVARDDVEKWLVAGGKTTALKSGSPPPPPPPLPLRESDASTTGTVIATAKRAAADRSETEELTPRLVVQRAPTITDV